jgi:hypothetical protein
LSAHLLYSVASGLLKIYKRIYSFLRKIINLCRPQLIIKYKTKSIKFTLPNNDTYVDDYFCIYVTNNSNKSLSLNLRGLKINSNLYQASLQGDTNFLRLNPASKEPFKACNNYIYMHYHKHWEEIHDGACTLKLDPGGRHIFPLSRDGISNVEQRDINTLLFFDKKKVTVSINCNNRRYDYGLNRLEIYERLINHLNFYRDRLSCSHHKEDKNHDSL